MTDTDIVRTWESGEGKSPAERALALLGGGYPERPAAELRKLPIGERDALLLSLREKLLGSKLRGYVECPRCAERLVFTLQSSSLRLPAPGAGGPRELRHGDWVVSYRLPDSEDLIAAGRRGEVASARAELLGRCVLSLSRDAAPVPARQLPPELEAALVAAMAEDDAQADLWLTMCCAACENSWQARFDIGVFLWTEFAAQARGLLDEVAVLARAFGWAEADILRMSAARRQQYVQRALS